jgi:hypothetical protein
VRRNFGAPEFANSIRRFLVQGKNLTVFSDNVCLSERGHINEDLWATVCGGRAALCPLAPSWLGSPSSLGSLPGSCTPSMQRNRDAEEPDVLIALVRVCGGAVRVNCGSTRNMSDCYKLSGSCMRP